MYAQFYFPLNSNPWLPTLFSCSAMRGDSCTSVMSTPSLLSWLAAFIKQNTGFPDGSAHKESTCSAGDTEDTGSIPGWGRAPGEGNGSLLQYSCLENPIDRGTWLVTGHGVAKHQTWLNTRYMLRYNWQKLTKSRLVPGIIKNRTDWLVIIKVTKQHQIGKNTECKNNFPSGPVVSQSINHQEQAMKTDPAGNVSFMRIQICLIKHFKKWVI